MGPHPRRPTRPHRAHRPRRGRLVAAAATVAVVALGAACGGDDTGPSGLTGPAATGEQLYRERGCQGCHGPDGSGGIGPALAGIAGTERELVDGSIVVADTDYLRRSITDPDAEITAGYSVRMPSNQLDDDQVDALVAYIEALEESP